MDSVNIFALKKTKELRDKVKIIDTTTSSIPALSAFSNIEKATIRIGVESIAENLTFLGSTPSLKSLSLQIQHTPFNLTGKKSGQLKSLKGLDAPNLISLSLQVLDFLTFLVLKDAQNLRSSYYQATKNWRALLQCQRIAPSLVNVELSNSPAITGLEPLQTAASLELLSVNFLERITNLSTQKLRQIKVFLNSGAANRLSQFLV